MNKSSKIFLIILTIISITLISNNSFCKNHLIVKPSKDTVYYKNIVDPGEIVLKYKTILEEDSKGHREYLERLYTIAISIFGALGAVLLVIVYSSWGRTKKEIRNQVDENFKLKVNDIIKEQTEMIETLYKRKLNNFTFYTRSLLIDLMSKAVVKVGDNPLHIDYESLKGKRILWADDKPEHNIHHREVFNTFGVEFVTTNTTEDAIALLTSNPPFDLIISNMGRPPKGKEENNPREGIVFLKLLKEMNSQIPTIIYTKPANVENYGDEVNHLDASITQGYTDLFKEILRNIAK